MRPEFWLLAVALDIIGATEFAVVAAVRRSSQPGLLGAAPFIRPPDGQIFARKAVEDRLAGV